MEEEDAENLLSIVGDILVRGTSIFLSNEMDFSTKRSHLLADMLNAVTFEDDNQTFFFHWYYEICSWFQLKILIIENKKSRTPFPGRRDDRVTGLAYYAAFMSVQKVLIENFSKIFYRNRYSNRITIKIIKEEFLNSFDILCKDLLIDKSWEVVSIRECIMKSAKLALDYINSSQEKNLSFPGKDSDRDQVLWIFQGYLIGNFDQDGEFLLKKNASKNLMDKDTVGLIVDFQKIKDRLTRSNSKLDIIPIIGMGGIGKTTLTRKVYKDPQMTIFQIRAWIVVSREFNERDVLLGLLESIAPLPSEVYEEDTEELPERLYRRLKGWRYFIVLDDIWTKEAWDRIKFCFPDDNNGSRIILTSRINEVASHVDHENPPHFMSFLSIEDSWELLWNRAYGEEVCPRHLTNIGMQIAKKCQGLPLAIEVMAGYLSSISKTRQCWEDVAKRVDFPTEVTQLESLSKILFISFDELPHQLKACFLTMILFPKNFTISVRKLIQMWTAMEFLGQYLSDNAKDVTLEELAMTYFKSLTERSLITIKEKKYNGEAKLCGVHDLLWDLSMREFCKQFSCDDDHNHVIRIYRTLLYFGHSFRSDYPINFEGFKLIRVLDIINQTFDHFPIDVTSLGNLRYLALSTSGNIPQLICKLSYLETLLNYHERANQMLPTEIWLLAHLKHLRVGTCTFLCEPPNLLVEESSNSLLPCLLSLSNLSSSSCNSEIFLNIQHLKQLGIIEHEREDLEDKLLCSALENIVNLHQLEKFKLCCNFKIRRQRCIPNLSSFLPNTIKKLTLSQSYLPWSKMKTLATLPTLEVLKLKNNAFEGKEWVMDDEEFLNLKYLMLESMNLNVWKASNDNFPNLQHLVINFCTGLSRIPREFGEIYTLELIDLDFFTHLIYVSAIEIQRDQTTLGNYKFKVQFGRTMPQFHTMGYFLIFVWLVQRLNMPKTRGQKMKNKKLPSSSKDLL